MRRFRMKTRKILSVAMGGSVLLMTISVLNMLEMMDFSEEFERNKTILIIEREQSAEERSDLRDEPAETEEKHNGETTKTVEVTKSPTNTTAVVPRSIHITRSGELHRQQEKFREKMKTTKEFRNKIRQEMAVHFKRMNRNRHVLTTEKPKEVTEGSFRIIERFLKLHENEIVLAKQSTSSINVADILDWKVKKNAPNFEKFWAQISPSDIYQEDMLLQNLLSDLATLRIIDMDQKSGGTQLKMVGTLENGGQFLFKPMRFSRDTERSPNHFYFSDYERHTAEIAAFHLDKILGFRRAPPVTGRLVNITADIYPFVDKQTLKTFFVSPDNNLCFHGQCEYYCDTSHAICGNPDMLEGSLAAFLPPEGLVDRKKLLNPWKRSYHKRRLAKWQTDSNYCKDIMGTTTFSDETVLLDIIDVTLMDFIMGNMDRHHIEYFPIFGERTLILLDNGRAFARPNRDEMSILVPLIQCCRIRASTLHTIYQFFSGKALSLRMKESLLKDPLSPILQDKHFRAMDRRVIKILQSVEQCISGANETTKVIRL